MRIHCPSYFDGLRHHPEGGVLVLREGRIAAIENLPEPETSRHYWCPGWVNAHCHLELTHLAGTLPARVPFPDWLNAMRKQLETWTLNDFQASYKAGLRQALQTGTTTLYDVGNTGSAPASQTSPRLFAMPELLGLNPPLHAPESPSVPHALYSTHPTRILQTVESCFRAAMPWSIHLGESLDEQLLLTEGTGPFRRWLDQRIPQHPFTHPGTRPLTRFTAILEGSPAACSSGWIVHGNYLDRSDLQTLAERKWPLVHCPQSREWFSHPLPDFATCRELGVELCVATDSLASADSLDLREQLRVLRKHSPHLFSCEELLSMITAVPGKYLGGTGRLAADAPADLICLTLPEVVNADRIPEAALDPRTVVSAVWQAGRPLTISKET